MNETIDHLDRLDTIACCLEAVSDLMAPGADLHAVDRDKQSLLLTFLMAEHKKARDNLCRSIKY